MTDILFWIKPRAMKKNMSMITNQMWKTRSEKLLLLSLDKHDAINFQLIFSIHSYSRLHRHNFTWLLQSHNSSLFQYTDCIEVYAKMLLLSNLQFFHFSSHFFFFNLLLFNKLGCTHVIYDYDLELAELKKKKIFEKKK
jgi:hypothetical protein